MKIGIFDSGVGGRSFVESTKKRFPNAEIVYKEDKDNLPYGGKTPERLLELTCPIFKEFELDRCDAVLVACNTVTTTIIGELRKQINIPLVGVEPMIKSAAAMTKSKVIAVCATPATLSSNRYAYLKQEFAKDIVVVEPDCSKWAEMIEQNRTNELKMSETIEGLRSKSVDVVVLGCTHYNWIEKELDTLSGPEMQVIQPIEPVLDQLERVLANSL